jgi:hypothetical protein
MSGQLARLQHQARQAQDWLDLYKVLVEAFELRHVSAFPDEILDDTEYSLELSPVAIELLEDPKVGLKSLKTRGWTVRLLEMYPEPIAVPNPHDPRFAPMRLWRVADIKDWEKGPIRFQLLENLEKSEKRKKREKELIAC